MKQFMSTSTNDTSGVFGEVASPSMSGNSNVFETVTSGDTVTNEIPSSKTSCSNYEILVILPNGQKKSINFLEYVKNSLSPSELKNFDYEFLGISRQEWENYNQKVGKQK